MAQLFTNATLVLPDRLLPKGWLLEETEKLPGTAAAHHRRPTTSLTAAASICLPALSMSTATAVVAAAL